MTDWPIFIMGLFATSIVVVAVVAIGREERAAQSGASERRDPPVRLSDHDPHKPPS